jgi:hypothetical protein
MVLLNITQEHKNGNQTPQGITHIHPYQLTVKLKRGNFYGASNSSPD